MNRWILVVLAAALASIGRGFAADELQEKASGTAAEDTQVRQELDEALRKHALNTRRLLDDLCVRKDAGRAKTFLAHRELQELIERTQPAVHEEMLRCAQAASAGGAAVVEEARPPEEYDGLEPPADGSRKLEAQKPSWWRTLFDGGRADEHKEPTEDEPASAREPDPKATAARGLGERAKAFFDKKDYRAAAELYHELGESARSAPQAPYAELMEAVCWNRLGEKAREQSLYEGILRDHPDSRVVPLAEFYAGKSLGGCSGALPHYRHALETVERLPEAGWLRQALEKEMRRCRPLR